MRNSQACGWGVRELEKGEDPSSHFSRALEDYGQAIRLNPLDKFVWVNRGDLRGRWAYYRLRRGEEGAAQFREALEDLDEAIRLAGLKKDMAWYVKGTIYVRWGRASGKPAEKGELFRAGIAAYEKALQLSPSLDAVWFSLGEARMEMTAVGAQDLPAEYQGAIDCYSKAIDVNGERDNYWRGRAISHLLLASYQRERGSDGVDGFERALKDIDRAIGLRGSNAESWRWRGMICGSWFLALDPKIDGETQKRKDFQAQAMQAFQKAIDLDPHQGENWFRRGEFRFRLGMWRQALEDFEEIVRRNPLEEPLARSMLQECRRRFEKEKEQGF